MRADRCGSRRIPAHRREHVGKKTVNSDAEFSTGRNGAVALTASSSGFTATKISKQRHKDF
jgi:hypothetical protein